MFENMTQPRLLKTFPKQKDCKKSNFLGGVMGEGKNIHLSCLSKGCQSKTHELLILYFYTMEMGFKENC